MADVTRYRLDFEQPIQEMEARLAELEARQQTARTGPSAPPPAVAQEFADQIRRLRREIQALIKTIYAGLSPAEIVKVSRCEARPQTRDYVNLIFDHFVELHGDRAVGDDQAIVTGLATLDDQQLLLVGHQKGRTLAERQASYFGCAHPEGYRKALVKMRLAEKLGLPIVCLIDTPGAYPGIGAEERGQAAIIAENLLAMSLLRTPIVCVVIGEGGSGGALGIGIGDRVAMMEYAYYSVISPEGCATILWKSAEHAPRAAESLKLTSRDLLRFGIIDAIVPEPVGGAHRDRREAATLLKNYLLRSLRELADIPPEQLLALRYDKFRKMGVVHEPPQPAAATGRGGEATRSAE